MPLPHERKRTLPKLPELRSAEELRVVEPLRPSARGSRPPLPDVPFTVPTLAPAEPGGEILALSARPPAELDVDSSSDSAEDDPGAGLVRAAASPSASGTFDLVSLAPAGAPASTCVLYQQFAKRMWLRPVLQIRLLVQPGRRSRMRRSLSSCLTQSVMFFT